MFTCLDCGRNFLQKHDLYRHQRSVHNGQTVFSCSGCDKHFNRHANMLRHQQICNLQYSAGLKRKSEEDTPIPTPAKLPKTDESFTPTELESALKRALVTYRLDLATIETDD